MNLITLTQNIVNMQFELNLIGANARGLRGPGRDLLPLKIDMLAGLAPNQQAAIMEAVELLFAAIMQFVDARFKEIDAKDPISLINARIERGQADGTVIALTHGSTRHLLLAAYQAAPIAMHTIMQIAPRLDIQNRLSDGLAMGNEKQKKRLKLMRKIAK